MKDIVITIQGALLTHLRYAEGNNGRLDILALLSASDYGRMRTIAVLRELYQRLAQAAAVPGPIVAIPGSTAVDPRSSLAYYIDLIERLSSLPGGCSALPGLPSGPYLPALVTGSPPDMPGLMRQIESSPQSPLRRSSTIGSTISSWWRDLQRRRSSADSSVVSNITETESVTRPVSQYATTPPTTEPREQKVPARPSKGKQRRNSLQDDLSRELFTNIWQHDSRSLADSDTDPDSEEENIGPLNTHQQNLQQSSTSPITPSTAPVPTLDLPHPPSIASDDTTPSTTNSASSHTALPHNPATPPGPLYWPPSKENRYAGFCKGAWKLNSGLGGFKVHSEPIGYFTLITKWRCYRCHFAMPLARGSQKHDHRIDEAVYTHRPTGLRYRWAFLAKSHVACKKPAALTPHNARGPFGCIFCCALRNEPAPVFEELDGFMVHLGLHHRGMDAAALLERTKCVVGRVAAEREVFDINIPPSR